jgi:hypothetical protein
MSLAEDENSQTRCMKRASSGNFYLRWRNDALSDLQETCRFDSGQQVPTVLFGALPHGRPGHLGR